MKFSAVEIGARVESFENSFIPHDALKNAKETMLELHARYRPPGKRKLKARALLLLGDSGAGKSTVLESYKADHPGTIDEADADFRPVVVVEAPKKTTPRQLAAAILNTLSPNQRIRDAWNAAKILSEICYVSDELRVAMLMIDEAHHLMDQKNDADREDAAEFIKSLLNQSRAQVVLCGLPHLESDLPKTKKLDQLRRRIDGRILLRPYNWSTEDGRVNFCALLGSFERNLGLPEASDLSEESFAVRIYGATNGEVGLVSKELSRALRHALKNGRRRLDLKLMAEVWTPPSDSKRDRQEELLGDFDAPAIKMKTLPDRANNPYLANTEQFRLLWRAMAADRFMDTSAKTRHKKTGLPDSDPLAA